MTIHRFLEFELDTNLQELRHSGRAVAIEPQVFDLLQYLIENRNRVVTRDELFENIWRGRIVSDATLSSRVKAARQAVGDDGKIQSVIQTLPRRGFRFVATAQDAADQQSVAITPQAEKQFQAEPEQASKPSLAVLPFDNKSGDPEQEYFADGIAEDIITALSHIRQFFVVARNTTFTFKGKAVDVQAVAQDLGVRYVLEGSVRRSSNRVRITVQLVDGRTGNHLWAERYDRDLEDVFAVQDEITQTVVGAIQPELSRTEQERARLKQPENMDAWDCYQRGIWHTYQRTKDDYELAQDLFHRAIAFDPNMSQAYAGLVETYFFQVADSNTANRDHTISEAIAAAQTAVDLDSRDAMAHYALGRAYTIAGRHDEAIPRLQDAIDLNPSLARAYYALGFALVNSGYPEQGIEPLKTAVRLSPHDPTVGQFMVQISRAYLFLDHYGEALKWAKEALGRPNIRWTRWTTLISTLGHLNRLDEAAKAIEALHRLKPEVNFDFVEKGEIAVNSHTPYRHQFMDGLRKAGFETSGND